MENMEPQLYCLEEKRLARLLRQVAISHIRREYYRACDLLTEGELLIAASHRADWGPGLLFLKQWHLAVRKEREGQSLEAAPAAWIHLGQELADVMEGRGNWIVYLESRWRLEVAKFSASRRFFYAALALGTLGLSALIIFFLLRGLFHGRADLLLESVAMPREKGLFGFLLLFGRVAGTVLMTEHGLRWARHALVGKGTQVTAVFLGKELSLAT